MLILSRRPDGSLCIGPNIRITALGVKATRPGWASATPKTSSIAKKSTSANNSRLRPLHWLPCRVRNELAVRGEPAASGCRGNRPGGGPLA
jgi:hypothetical protein